MKSLPNASARPSDQIMGNGLTFCRILIPTQKVFGLSAPVALWDLGWMIAIY